MKIWCLLLGAVVAALAQPRTDNVLVKMVPPGSTSLVGARMDQIKATEFYRKLLEQQKLPQMEQFAEETGFDPRRDVREMLFASTAIPSPRQTPWRTRGRRRSRPTAPNSSAPPVAAGAPPQ